MGLFETISLGKDRKDLLGHWVQSGVISLDSPTLFFQAVFSQKEEGVLGEVFCFFGFFCGGGGMWEEQGEGKISL